jgi:hypothetical protein
MTPSKKINSYCLSSDSAAPLPAVASEELTEWGGGGGLEPLQCGGGGDGHGGMGCGMQSSSEDPNEFGDLGVRGVLPRGDFASELEESFFRAAMSVISPTTSTCLSRRLPDSLSADLSRTNCNNERLVNLYCAKHLARC